MARPRRIDAPLGTSNDILSQIPTLDYLEQRQHELTEELCRVNLLLETRQRMEGAPIVQVLPPFEAGV